MSTETLDQVALLVAPGPSARQAGTKNCRYGSRNKFYHSRVFCAPGRNKELPKRLKGPAQSPAQRSMVRERDGRDKISSRTPRAYGLKSAGGLRAVDATSTHHIYIYIYIYIYICV